MRRGSEQTPESEKPQLAGWGFSSKRSTFGNGCCVRWNSIQDLETSKRWVPILMQDPSHKPFRTHITHASFGSIRWYAPTARWMEHVAQAHGLGRTGVEGMVIPVSANCVAHQLTQPDAVASDKATWLLSRVRESFVRFTPRAKRRGALKHRNPKKITRSRYLNIRRGEACRRQTQPRNRGPMASEKVPKVRSIGNSYLMCTCAMWQQNHR